MSDAPRPQGGDGLAGPKPSIAEVAAWLRRAAEDRDTDDLAPAARVAAAERDDQGRHEQVLSEPTDREAASPGGAGGGHRDDSPGGDDPTQTAEVNASPEAPEVPVDEVAEDGEVAPEPAEDALVEVHEPPVQEPDEDEAPPDAVPVPPETAAVQEGPPPEVVEVPELDGADQPPGGTDEPEGTPEGRGRRDVEDETADRAVAVASELLPDGPAAQAPEPVATEGATNQVAVEDPPTPTFGRDLDPDPAEHAPGRWMRVTTPGGDQPAVTREQANGAVTHAPGPGTDPAPEAEQPAPEDEDADATDANARSAPADLRQLSEPSTRSVSLFDLDLAELAARARANAEERASAPGALPPKQAYDWDIQADTGGVEVADDRYLTWDDEGTPAGEAVVVDDEATDDEATDDEATDDEATEAASTSPAAKAASALRRRPKARRYPRGQLRERIGFLRRLRAMLGVVVLTVVLGVAAGAAIGAVLVFIAFAVRSAITSS